MGTASGVEVRAARADDVEAIGRLAGAARHRRAGWEPGYWAVAPGADELHPLWLGHLVGSGDAVARVATDGGEVVACAFATRQPSQWFVDDVAVAPGRWGDAGVAVLAAVAEHPALVCVPTADTEQRRAVASAGWAHVSDYRLLRLPEGDGGHVPTPAPEAGSPAVAPVPDRTSAEGASAPHTFGGPLADGAPGALHVVSAAGCVVGSPPLAAPPVYDPGGTTCVVDRIEGRDRPALVDAAVAGATALGAVQLLVVCAAADHDLRSLLDARGFRHPVAVHQAPPSPR